MACSNAGTRLIRLTALCLVCAGAGAQELRVVSGDWHPYVDSTRTTEVEAVVENLLVLALAPDEGAQSGQDTALEEAAEETAVSWRYPGFYFAVEHLRNGTAEAGFPFFRTPERDGEFIFSDAVFEVDNVIVYNRDVNDFSSAPAELTDAAWQDRRIALVAGYSYAGLAGYAALEAVRFGSEERAIAALLAGEVDILPIEHSVWRSLVLRRFPNQYYRLAEVPGGGWSAGVHVMMPAADANEVLLERFDELLEEFRANQDVDFDYPMRDIVATIERGTAVLEATEMQPLIVGHARSGHGFAPSFVIPEATAVIITDWADPYMRYRPGVSVVQQLQGLSRVLLLDGPHAGSEVWVQNAHIRIR